jgi:hypothetical protein
MYPPKNDWTWVDGRITHFDLEAIIKQDLKTTVRALKQGLIEEEYIHGDFHEDHGWQDDNLELLTENADRNFAFPEPSE